MKMNNGPYPVKLLAVVFTGTCLPICPATAEVTFTRVEAGELGQVEGNVALAWGDYDGDGYVDLFASFIPYLVPFEPNRLFHNEGDGTFTRVLDGGIADDPDETGNPLGAAWADFENDGDLDLYIAYNDPYVAPKADRLYLNNGDGTFTRSGQDWITPEYSMQPTWGDFDNDGLLDLFVTGHTTGVCFLYHHQPDGSMLPIEFRVSPDETVCHGASISDVDLDGDIDLLIATDRVLFWNEGDLVFTDDFRYQLKDITGIGAADYDNDGDPDIAVSVFMPNSSPSHLYQNSQLAGRLLWKDLGNTQFPTVEPSWMWSLAWGDYDNDGYVDLLIPTATIPEFFELYPWMEGETNKLYHNEGDGTFTLVTEGPLVTDYGNSSGVAWADYDNDGDLDVALSDGGGKGGVDIIVPEAPVALYRNDGGNDNHWLTLTLVGTVSNRSAIGAKVYAYASINGVDLQQMREVVSSSGYVSQNDMRVHFGLGDATAVDTLRIEWPSGIVQEMQGVAANQFLTIEENAPSWAGYPVTDGWADTGDFMGWLYIEEDPWIISASLGGRYIFCQEENVGESGAWVYIQKP